MVYLEQWLVLNLTCNFLAVLRGMNWFTGSQGAAVVYWGISVTSCSVSVGKVFTMSDSLLFCMNSQSSIGHPCMLQIFIFISFISNGILNSKSTMLFCLALVNKDFMEMQISLKSKTELC